MYYAAEIWLIPTLKPALKQQLLSISTQALRIVADDFYHTFNSTDLHVMLSRFNPKQMSIYVSLLNLYRCFNNRIPETIWIDLQFKFLPLTRTNKFLIPPTNKLRVGTNLLSNRLSYASTLITNDDLNREYISFKLLVKRIVRNLYKMFFLEVSDCLIVQEMKMRNSLKCFD